MVFIPDNRYHQLLRRETEYLELKEQGVAAWMDAYHLEQVENAALTKRITALEKVEEAANLLPFNKIRGALLAQGLMGTCERLDDLQAAQEGRE